MCIVGDVTDRSTDITYSSEGVGDIAFSDSGVKDITSSSTYVRDINKASTDVEDITITGTCVGDITNTSQDVGDNTITRDDAEDVTSRRRDCDRAVPYTPRVVTMNAVSSAVVTGTILYCWHGCKLDVYRQTTCLQTFNDVPACCFRLLLLSVVALGNSFDTPSAKGLQCLYCTDKTNPRLCANLTTCMPNQMCFTHKYTYSNIINYDMGCQTAKVCSLAHNRPSLVGKRDRGWESDDWSVRTVCYECCNSNGCNNALCLSPINTTPVTASTSTAATTTTTTTTSTTTPSPTTVTSPTTTTTTTRSTVTSSTPTTSMATFPTSSVSTSTTSVATTTAKTHCPSGYVGFESSCYIIVYKSVHWDSAQSRCQQLGSGVHLVSVNSQEEQDFLAKLLDDAHFPAAEIWIGGYIHPFFRRWTWDDGTKFEYTSWVSGYPINDKTRDKMTMVNPNVNSAFSGWNWKNNRDDVYYAFICEVKA